MSSSELLLEYDDVFLAVISKDVSQCAVKRKLVVALLDGYTPVFLLLLTGNLIPISRVIVTNELAKKIITWQPLTDDVRNLKIFTFFLSFCGWMRDADDNK
jgi:hypothetical protein